MYNEREYKLKISPEILELLGPNLYTNIYYVLAELIANAYDADATNVYIIEEEGRIIVEDDGTGMSYDDGVKRYLKVANPSRTSIEDDLTTVFSRRKMGRKGIGKLAALSVSNNVRIQTKSELDESGFILSRNLPEDGMLVPIPGEEIEFRFITRTGTSITMESDGFGFSPYLGVQKRNLLRMFPDVNSNFRIHLIKDGKSEILDSFEDDTVEELATLITVGDDFKHLNHQFHSSFSDIEKKVNVHLEAEDCSEILSMTDKSGTVVECKLEIKGWIGTYRSTTGRKKTPSDFPDNYLSIFANNKLGQFNIIPSIGQNRMNESYVVGQLYIDLFERTDLPDMALSNRQGYRTDDPRYKKALELIKNKLFIPSLNMREIWSSRKNKEKEDRKKAELEENEETLIKNARQFSNTIVEEISSKCGVSRNPEKLREIAETSISKNLGLLGLKKIIDSSKKRIFISFASEDIVLADFIFKLLIDAGMPSDFIIYTNGNEENRVPYGCSIYDYLRDFFVKSISSQLMHVVFITSTNSEKKWAPVCEVGAAWVTSARHDIFNIRGCKPQSPLSIAPEYHTSEIIDGEVWMKELDVDKLKVKIREICLSVGVQPVGDDVIKNNIENHIKILKI